MVVIFKVLEEKMTAVKIHAPVVHFAWIHMKVLDVCVHHGNHRVHMQCQQIARVKMVVFVFNYQLVI